MRKKGRRRSEDKKGGGRGRKKAKGKRGSGKRGKEKGKEARKRDEEEKGNHEGEEGKKVLKYRRQEKRREKEREQQKGEGGFGIPNRFEPLLVSEEGSSSGGEGVVDDGNREDKAGEDREMSRARVRHIQRRGNDWGILYSGPNCEGPPTFTGKILPEKIRIDFEGKPVCL